MTYDINKQMENIELQSKPIYQINNLNKFEKEIVPHIELIKVGQYDDNGVNIGFVSAEDLARNFVKADRQEAYEAGRREGLDDLVNEIEKHEWFTEMNEDWDMIKEQINKLKQ